MTADVEDEYIVAQANEPLDENGHFINEKVSVRYRDSVQEVPREKADYMDVSPKMVVSVATAMIPFLENDDANRALMGANMQRQAVPLSRPSRPLSAPVWNTVLPTTAALWWSPRKKAMSAMLMPTASL